MIHFIIVATVAWIVIGTAYKALLSWRIERDTRRRIMPGGTPQQHAAIVNLHKREHDTFAQRHTVDFNRPADEYQTACERHRCARQRRLDGYGTAADLETERAFLAKYDGLKWYGRAESAQ